MGRRRWIFLLTVQIKPSLVGLPDEADREYYIPDTVATLTASELNTKVLALHAD